jgi:hypothetical protein
MIQHGINTIIFIDVLNPFCWNSSILSNYINPMFSTSPFLNQELLLSHHQIDSTNYKYNGTNWVVVPIHTIYHEVFAIDH